MDQANNGQADSFWQLIDYCAELLAQVPLTDLNNTTWIMSESHYWVLSGRENADGRPIISHHRTALGELFSIPVRIRDVEMPKIVWWPEDLVSKLESEAWGALGWLEGMVELSDRARAYKAKKLREILEAMDV